MSIKEEVVQYLKVAVLVALALSLFANAFTTAEAQTRCATGSDVMRAADIVVRGLLEISLSIDGFTP